MALIQCPECGKKISSEAEACPHCGYVISRIENLEDVIREQEKRSKSNKTNIIMIIAVILIVVVLFSVWDYSQHSFTRAQKEAEKAAQEYYEIR